MIWRWLSLVAWLMLAVSVPAQNGDTLLAEPITIGEYDQIHHDAGVSSIELRADDAVGVAIFELARRSEAFEDAEIGAGCIAVLIIDETSLPSDVAQAVERFATAGCELRRLEGDATQWIGAGLAVPAKPRPKLGPGDVPFIIPRGLCEPRDPVQTFNP